MLSDLSALSSFTNHYLCVIMHHFRSTASLFLATTVTLDWYYMKTVFSINASPKNLFFDLAAFGSDRQW